MRKLSLTMVIFASIVLFSCRENKNGDMDANGSMGDTVASMNDDNQSSSSTATYSDNVDGTVNSSDNALTDTTQMSGDMTAMYSQLQMTDDQVQQYETANKTYMDNVASNKNINRQGYERTAQ